MIYADIPIEERRVATDRYLNLFNSFVKYAPFFSFPSRHLKIWTGSSITTGMKLINDNGVEFGVYPCGENGRQTDVTLFLGDDVFVLEGRLLNIISTLEVNVPEKEHVFSEFIDFLTDYFPGFVDETD